MQASRYAGRPVSILPIPQEAFCGECPEPIVWSAKVITLRAESSVMVIHESLTDVVPILATARPVIGRRAG